MQTHRFHLSPDDCRSDRLILSDREAHHAANVLRVRRDETVTVLDGMGTTLVCRVEMSERKRVELRVTERRTTPPLPFNITLLQAVPKGKIIESIIQKATELGVSRIIPLLTDRVATRLDEERADHKGDKWQQIAVEAIKQCGSPWLPKVEPPRTPGEFLSRGETFDLPLIASLQPGASHPRQFFDRFQNQHQRKPKSVCIWIGPEGDFTPEEVAAVIATGAHPITLGRLVLRVETAAIYCLSILNYELLSPEAA